MKKLVITLVSGLILLTANFVQAYVVDGKLDDWGVTPGPFGSSQWIPYPGIYSVIEDQNTYFLDPGYGGQAFDAEAMYLDFDATNLYFAIVTGFPSTGKDGVRSGDIAFDFGLDNSYEYGIETTGNGGFTKGSLYSVSNWGKGLNNWGYGTIGYLGAPTEMLNAELLYNPTETNLVYNKTYYGTNSKGNHSVIEGYIPYSYFTADWGKPLRVHWTMTCGNDYINLDIPAVSPVPEPGTLILFGSGLFGLLITAVRRFFTKIKTITDLIGATLIVLLSSPLLLLIAILVKLTSRGPVFIKQERVGENRRWEERRALRRADGRRSQKGYGRVFMLYKFRSMYIDAEKDSGPVWAGKNDLRITPLGHILRKTHLDELPQMINVLKGEMSIIGPRPERPMFVKTLHAEIKKYPNRLRVKPGITGLAQVKQHYDTSLRDVKRKVHYDLLYIKKMCLLMDLRIILGTVGVMLTGKGAR